MADFPPIYGLDPTPEEMAMARANALRRMAPQSPGRAEQLRSAGFLAQLTGDSVLAPLGKSLVGAAQAVEESDATDRQHALTRAMQARTLASTEAERKTDNARADENLDISRKRLALEQSRPPPGAALASTRKDALVGRLADTMTKQLDEGQWHGPIAKQVEAKNQAEHLMALAQSSAGNINNLTGPEQEELAMGFAKLIAGGHGTEGQVKELVPPTTLQSGAAGIMEWLRNEPQGRNQVEFVRRMAHSVERQKGVAEGLINEEKAKRAGSHRKLKELDPEQHQAVLEGAGLDSANFDERGVYRQPKAAGAATGPKGPTIIQRGHTYNWNPQTGAYE